MVMTIVRRDEDEQDLDAGYGSPDVSSEVVSNNQTQNQASPTSQQAPEQGNRNSPSSASGFVNLEDYLRANEPTLGKFAKMAKDDFGGLRNENKDMLDVVNPDRQQARPEYSYMPGASLKRSVGDLLPGEEYSKGYYNGDRLPESSKKNKADGLEKRGNEYFITDNEAKGYNDRLTELKNYYTGKRNEGYQKEANDLVGKANKNSYNKTLTDNPFLAQDENAILGRATDIKNKAKNMASQDYWGGRVGYDKDEGMGNALDSFLAYRGGGQEAQKLATGFDGLDSKLREKLGLRKGELKKKDEFNNIQSQIDALRDKSDDPMSLDEIFKARDTWGAPETVADLLEYQGPVDSTVNYYDPARGPTGHKKQKIVRMNQGWLPGAYLNWLETQGGK